MRHYNDRLIVFKNGIPYDLRGASLHSYNTASRVERIMKQSVKFVEFDISGQTFYAKRHENEIVFCSPDSGLHGQLIDAFDRFLEEPWIKSMILRGMFKQTDQSFEYIKNGVYDDL